MSTTKRRFAMSTKLEAQTPSAAPRKEDARGRLLAGIPVTERRLRLAGVSTSVLEGGEGPPVVLLHGPGGYGAMWQQVIPELTTGYRIVAPDLPGHGASSMMAGRLDDRRMNAWLGELIEETCATTPSLVGQLIGGALAVRFAADHGDQVGRLVLVVPFGLAPFQPTPAFGAALSGFLTEPSGGAHDELWAQCVFDLDALRRQPGARWELMRAYNLELATDGGVAGSIQALMARFGFDAIPDETLSKIAVPTALIWGRGDSIVPLSVGEAASTRYHWPLHVIENAGNEPAIEAPEAFLAALRSAFDAEPERRT
jgi:pimeloyl-ACP methyl ester carboxylesterase